MSPRNNVPDHAVTIRTYQELENYSTAFANERLNLLFLFGGPGLGKSRHMRQAMMGEAFWIDATASPFGIYSAAFRNRNKPLVLDDVDGLFRDRNGIRLLKSLCQTEVLKRVSWETAAPALKRDGIPRQFTTSSRVAIIANQWQSFNPDVLALEDRGHVVHFAPDPVEVHRHAAKWFWDQEIFNFVAAHLHLLKQPSLRTYGLAWELKAAHLDWKSSILCRCLQGVALEVAKLKADQSFATEEDRVREFIAAGHGCRATYFNQAKKLRPIEPVENLILRHDKPPLPPPKVDLMDVLRKQFGQLGNG